MRIQHNIMAMNAYRNYSNNTSALSKNLEKLSSGYKINRAGDDAAGLAISEKMRAQITGLEAAQKNAKDGISLVQTAEGALTEVHDMLNRMVYLASQSANGTYDNETDRAQLQKEMDQLNKEINRIADSANFNGIKLLDGSMDANGYIRGTQVAADDGSPVYFKPSGTTGAVGTIAASGALNVGTKLHIGQTTGSTGTEFSVDLHEVKFDGKVGDKLTITLGEASKATTIELTVKTAAPSTGYNAGDIAKALSGGSNATNFDITVNGTAFTPGANAEMSIQGGKFKVTAGANGRISFQQKGVPTTAGEQVLGGMKVTVDSTPKNPTIEGTLTSSAVAGSVGSAGNAKKATYTFDFAGISKIEAGKFNVTVAGQALEIEFSAAEVTAASTATKAAKAVADKVIAAFTAAGLPADGITTTSKYTLAAGTGAKIVFTASASGTAAPAKPITGTIAVPTAADPRTTAVKGDYNMRTTDVKNVAAVGKEQLASTVISLNGDKIVKGGSIIIGNVDYTFSTASTDKANGNNKVYIGDMVDADGKFIKNDKNLQEVARRITDSAKDNATWTVGTTQDGKLSLVEKCDATGKATGNDAAKAYLTGGLDLTTKEGIAATLGYKGVVTDADPGKKGSSLTLQIGDTADDYNQLNVNIKDMHADKLGQDLKADGSLNTSNADASLTLATISIASQGDAAKAVDVIKRAINQVSDLRGTLGATQNRLDHTINNLSVMTENIQDAESTIRDTDVAEEMMAYTKNNILIQSAQAMLAQANQVPQGVLQLLQ